MSNQLSLLAAYDANKSTPATIKVGDKLINRREQTAYVTHVDANDDGPVYCVVRTDGIEAVWLAREVLAHFVRAIHCHACGNPDCPRVSAQPFFRTCQAVR